MMGSKAGTKIAKGTLAKVWGILDETRTVVIRGILIIIRNIRMIMLISITVLKTRMITVIIIIIITII